MADRTCHSLFQRYQHNPILTAREWPYRANSVFNAGAAKVDGAMACGTPTVACSRGSMPEIIRHGETGFLVSSVDDAVHAVNRVGEISRRRCREEAERRFSSERMVEQYLRVYRRVLQRQHC